MELDPVVKPQDDCTVVLVAGELDAATAGQLRQCLLTVTSEGPLRVVLDLSGLDFVDSTGLGVLISALKRQRSRGGSLALTGLGESVLRVFSITGLTEVFEVVDG